MSKPIKLGLIGLGRAGAGFHVPDTLRKSDKFQIVAVCDIICERADRLSGELACRGYYSMDDLLADPEVEMVDISTRSSDHYAHTLKAIAAGKDIMLEKPVAMNREELEDILSKTNQPGKPRVFFRHNRRFEPAFVEMMDIVKSGLLGSIFEAQLSEYGFQHRNDWQTISEFGGGQMLNWGPHLIDHALCFLGAPAANMTVNSIQAIAGGDCEDHFSIRMTGENGRFVTVSVSGSAALHNGRTYTLFGTRGAAVMTDGKIHLRYIDPEQSIPPVVSDPETPGANFGSSGTFASTIQLNWIEKDIETAPIDHAIILDLIYDSYRCGKEYPIKDEEILNLMDVITKAKAQPILKADAIF